MVKINNQRKAFLDMLAWSKGTDNGRQKTRNHGYDVIVGELFLITPITSQTCSPLGKTQINRRRTLPASFPLVGCLPQAAWPERLLSEKSGRCGIAADWAWRFMIDRGDIRRAIDRCSNIWASLPRRWLWSVPSIRLTA